MKKARGPIETASGQDSLGEAGPGSRNILAVGPPLEGMRWRQIGSAIPLLCGYLAGNCEFRSRLLQIVRDSVSSIGSRSGGIDKLLFKIRETRPSNSGNRPTPLFKRTDPQITIMLSPDQVILPTNSGHAIKRLVVPQMLPG